MIDSPNLKNLTASDYGGLKEKQHEVLQSFTKPHIDSFNYFLKEGLMKSVQLIRPVEFSLSERRKVSITITDASISPPCLPQGTIHATNLKVYPVECRERGTTYKGKLKVTVMWRVNNEVNTLDRVLGEVPIMVKSDACNIAKFTPAQLVRKGEEAEEMGGYFICNGNEKIVRMLIMPRRNFPLAINRPSWKGRGKKYTEFGVSARCVKADETGWTIVVHYLTNGTATLCFSYQKQQFFVPVVTILKALVNFPDQFIFQELTKGKENNSFYKGCVANMLRQCQDEGMTSQRSILKLLGERFRIKLNLPEWYTDVEIGQFLIKECIAVHLKDDIDKFNFIVLMTRKLFEFAKGEICAESADNPMNQEVLLAGHVYQMLLKEKMEAWLGTLRISIEKKMQGAQGGLFNLDSSTMSYCFQRTLDIGKPMNYFLATGNVISKSGLGLMQATGLTVVADKLNFGRYLSHFRCVHRGAFFAQMRTTAVRKLLPEAWGFLCPVHTPDGSPCGLMNHMSALCQVVNVYLPTAHLPPLLASMGMIPFDTPTTHPYKEYYTVLLDGKVIGRVHETSAKDFCDRLRVMKVKHMNKVTPFLEICLIPKTKYASQAPGIYLFASVARMIRPVKNLALNVDEMIGSFEQVYMDICIKAEEAHQGITTHMELNEFAMLSVFASLTPFSDFNQSPRNMYQCQMGKQTLGTPCHALTHRTDNKLYRIQSPQSPIVRPAKYDEYEIDNYPFGTNAVVAVISYTGYDMEDAMILNKSSYERGFGHGSVYKSEFIDLRELSGERHRITLVFGNTSKGQKCKNLDNDGLPFVGTYLQQGDPYYSYINIQTGELKVAYYKSQEPAYVDTVRILGDDTGTGELQKINVTLRINRNPIIGDKFASRHGQKGICSQKWPVENMPFSESGMQPDIIFNPHGFPSRMTIGMMIESMAGKSAAMHGLCHDATPFTFSEDNPAIDYFGRCLKEAGYNYYGTERLYSGIDGREFEVDIFVGVVYYQRLRHMVSDKFQVRTTGPRDHLTHQPVKGRKRGGGIRFGEMERDALISHGTAFLLQDRLFECSDKEYARICTKCGCILSPAMAKASSALAAISHDAKRSWSCSVCKEKDTIERIAIPYVLRYLVAELAAMNIKMKFEVNES